MFKKMITVLVLLIIANIKGTDACSDVTFQSIQLGESVLCQASCFRHEFKYYDKPDNLCLCTNNGSCGFTSVISQYPTSVMLTAEDAGIGEQIKITALVVLADTTSDKTLRVTLQSKEYDIKVVAGRGLLTTSVQYMVPGSTIITASVTSHGLTVRNTTTVFIKSELRVSDILVPNIAEAGKSYDLTTSIISGQNVKFSLHIQSFPQISFNVLDPTIVKSGSIFTSTSSTQPNQRYNSRTKLTYGYIFGVVINALKAGHLTLEVVCDTQMINSTILSVTSGENALILEHVLVNNTCYISVGKGSEAGIMTENTDDMLAGFVLADLALEVYLSSPCYVLAHLSFPNAGVYHVNTTVQSHDKEVSSSSTIQVKEKITGLTMVAALPGGDLTITADQTVYVTVNDSVSLAASVQSGSDVEFIWSTDKLAQIFSTPGNIEVSVTATNALGSTKSIKVLFIVQDESVAELGLNVMSGIKVEVDEGVFLSVGEVVKFIVTIKNGTGVYAELNFGNTESTVLLSNYNNRNNSIILPINHTYTKPYSTIQPTLCTTNTAGEICITLFKNLTLINPVRKPTILIDAHIKRGAVITGSTDIGGNGVFYFWTKDSKEINVTMTEKGVLFENVDVSVSNKRKQSFYFNKIGVSIIQLYVYNKVSWSHSKIAVIVEKPVQGVTAILSPSAVVKTNSIVNITITSDNTDDFNITIITDENTQLFKWQRKDILYHVQFTSPGAKDITIITQNNISQVTQVKHLVVQDPITVKFEILPSTQYFSMDDKLTFSSVSNTLDTSMLGSDPRYNWFLGDGIVKTGGVDGAENNLTHLGIIFNETGEYLLTCCVFNRITNICVYKEVNVLRTVSGLTVTYSNTSYIIEIQHLIYIRSSIESGSDTLFVAKVGDKQENFTTSGQQAVLYYMFPKAGVYPVSVTASNAISSISKSLPSYIYVQHKVGKVIVTRHAEMKQALYQSTMSTKNVWVELEIAGGTNCTLRCDFGDGTSVLSVEGLHTTYTGVVIDRSYLLNCSHNYMKAGIFPVKMTVLNGISSVDVQSTPTFVVNIPIGDVMIHISDTVTFGHEISLTATAKTGSNISYKWYVNSVVITSLTYPCNREGKLNFTVVVSNNLGNVTVNKTVFVETFIRELELSPRLSKILLLGSTTSFSLFLTPIASYNVKYLIDMGDGTQYTDPTVQHQYQEIGVYTITATVANSLSTRTVSNDVDIQDKILKVSIIGSFHAVSKQQSTYVAEVIKQRTDKVLANVKYEWKLDGWVQEQDASEISFMLDEVGQHEISVTVSNAVSSHSVTEHILVSSLENCKPPDVTLAGPATQIIQRTQQFRAEAIVTVKCDSKHYSTWEILTLNRTVVVSKPHSLSKNMIFSKLQPGTYIVRVEIHVDEQKMYGSDEQLLVVEQKSMIPILNYPTYSTMNTQETIRLSMRNSILLEANVSLENFTYYWDCSFVNTVINCTDLTRMNGSDIELKFNASGVARVNVEVHLRGMYTGSTYTILNVTNYIVPHVKVQLQNIQSVIHSQRIIFSLECHQKNVACVNPPIVWRISVLSATSCDSNSIPMSMSFTLQNDMTTTGINKPNLVIKSNVLSRGSVYKVEGCVWQVCSGEELHFKCGPTGGTCDLVQKGGSGLIDLNCYGWYSQEGSLQYEVSYQLQMYPVVVYQGPVSKIRFILPQGTHRVKVSVTDSSGTKSSLESFSVNVTSRMTDFNIKGLLNSTDYQLALQQITAGMSNSTIYESVSTAQYDEWIQNVKDVLKAMNDTNDMAIYISSISTAVVTLLQNETVESGLYLFLDYLQLVIRFLTQLLQSNDSLPEHILDIILEVLNKLLNLAKGSVPRRGEKRDTSNSLYLDLLDEAFSLCDEATALILTIQLNEHVDGEEDLEQKQELVGVLGRKMDELRGQSFQSSGYSFLLPKSIWNEDSQCLQAHMLLYDDNPYGWHDPVSSRLSSLTIRYCNGTKKQITDTDDIIITLPVNDKENMIESVFSLLTTERVDNSTVSQYIVEHRANIHNISLANHSPGSDLIMKIACLSTLDNSAVPLRVLVNLDLSPTDGTYLEYGLVNEGDSYNFYLSSDDIIKSNARSVIVSVTNYEDPTLPYHVQTPPPFRKYSIQYWFSQCLYRQGRRWSGSGCRASSDSTPTQSICYCTHLTLFASKLDVSPNELDIGSILTIQNLKNNHIVLTIVCTVIILYLVTLIILLKIDKSHGQNSAIIYLEDNFDRDAQAYLIKIVTGSQPNAGTTAKVNIKLYGRQRESHARLLTAQRSLFTSKSRETFVMKHPTSLGKLHHIHIWHDNTGKDSSWFLESIHVTDLSTNKTMYFPCHEWLAVEEGSGDIEKMIKSSKSPYKTRWDAFMSNASFSEHHLWASLLKDHTYAQFSRPQRFTVCVTLLFVIMATNIAFWIPANDTTFSFTILSLGWSELSMGVISGLITFPIILTILVLFRRSQARIPLLLYRDSATKATHVLSQASLQTQHENCAFPCTKPEQGRIGLTPVIEESNALDKVPYDVLEEQAAQQSIWCDGGLQLPWWCTVIAWSLCILVTLLSAIITVLYGLQFGNNKSLQWLASFAVSFLESVFISQPFIVIGCGIYAAMMFNKRKKKRPLSKAANITLTHMLPRNFTHKAYEGLARLKAFRYQSSKPPPHKATILAQREQSVKRKQCYEFFNSLFLHIFILIVLLLASNSCRADKGHWNNFGVRSTFVGRGPSSFLNITRPEHWYTWMSKTFIPRTYYEPKNSNIRGYTNDGSFYRVGQVKLRMKLRRQCPEGNGCITSWSSEKVKATFENNSGVLTAGKLAWYDQTGYEILLPNNQEGAQELLSELLQSSWISKGTSAAFVELTLYNPPTNTFVAVMLLTEFPGMSNALPTLRSDPLHILFRFSSHETILFIVIGLYVLGMVLLFKEIFNTYLEHKGSPYLTYNVILAIFMFGAFCMHLIRLVHVNKIREAVISKTVYLDLSDLCYINSIMMLCYGLATFFLIMRSTFLFKFFKIINIFHTVLYLSVTHLLHFTLYLGLTIVMFALVGMIIFGCHTDEFSTFTNSILSLLSVLSRNMKYSVFFQSHPLFAPIYFFLYYFSTFAVLLKIVTSIFIRTLFELRQGILVSQHQLELITYLWEHLVEWSGLEEPQTDNQSKSPLAPLTITTKVEEMEAYVDALLRTVESAVDTPHTLQAEGSMSPDEGIGLSSAMTTMSTLPFVAQPASSSSPSSQPCSSSSDNPELEEMNQTTQIIQQIFSHSISPITSPHLKPTQLTPVLKSPRECTKSRMSSMVNLTDKTSVSPHHPKPPTGSSRSNNGNSTQNFRKVKKSPKTRTVDVTPDLSSPYEQEILMKESAEIHESSDTAQNTESSTSSPTVPKIPQVNHKKSVLPPLIIKKHASISPRKDDIPLKSLSKYDVDRPIFGAGVQQTSSLTPVVQQTSSLTPVEMNKLSIEDMKEEEEEGKDKSQDDEAQLAFDQLRQHLQRGDTCPDILIKSILTEIDRPQTTPGGDKSNLQKQTALIAEHLMKGGWDEPMQREHTEMSLFSLFTRESTQLSDWASLSRESSLEATHHESVPKSLRPTTVTRPNAARPKVQFRHPSESSDTTAEEETRMAEITGNVSVLIKRALHQVSDAESVSHGSHQSSTQPSPESGPPEPIVTENTFIFNRKN